MGQDAGRRAGKKREARQLPSRQNAVVAESGENKFTTLTLVPEEAAEQKDSKKGQGDRCLWGRAESSHTYTKRIEKVVVLHQCDIGESRSYESRGPFTGGGDRAAG